MNGTQDHISQYRAVKIHHSKKDKGKKQIDNQCYCRTSNKIADTVQFPDTGYCVTHASGLEIIQRQSEQMSEQICAQCDVYAIGGMGKDIITQTIQQYIKNINYQQTHR